MGDSTAAQATIPVLLVHGLWDNAERIEPLARGLRERGVGPIDCVDIPGSGRAPIAALGEHVCARAAELCAEHGVKQLDLVGFSMGALACRYYLQRCGGRDQARRFISISGPHHGTLTAYGLPFTGVRQMRPGSALLADLASDEKPFGDVEVHCIYTPYDLMIVPSHSSVLPGVHSVHRVPVPIHRAMVSDRRVHDIVAKLLRR